MRRSKALVKQINAIPNHELALSIERAYEAALRRKYNDAINAHNLVHLDR